jgi:hypothetical protein
VLYETGVGGGISDRIKGPWQATSLNLGPGDRITSVTKVLFRSTTVITSSNMVGVDNNGHVPATVVTGRSGM